MSDDIPWITTDTEYLSGIDDEQTDDCDQSRDTDGCLEPDVGGDLLHQATKYNNPELLESLLQAEERRFIDKVHSDDETVLFIAVSNHYIECCHVLLEAGGKSIAII